LRAERGGIDDNYHIFGEVDSDPVASSPVFGISIMESSFNDDVSVAAEAELPIPCCYYQFSPYEDGLYFWEFDEVDGILEPDEFLLLL
jgi:hypothetical protein